MALGALLLVAGGAVAVAALVPSMTVAAEWAFGLASTGLVAYGVDRLDVLGAVERLLRFWRRM